MCSELIAIASNQKQRIVCRRTKNEHTGNASSRRVNDNSEMRGDQCHQLGRQLLGDANDCQRNKPKPRTPIRHQEQHRHHCGGCREQLSIGTFEHLGEICNHGWLTGYLCLHPCGEAGGRNSANTLNRLGNSGIVDCAYRDRNQRHRFVWRKDGGPNLPPNRKLCQPCGLRSDGVLLRVSQRRPIHIAVHDKCRRNIRGRELLLTQFRFSRLIASG